MSGKPSESDLTKDPTADLTADLTDAFNRTVTRLTAVDAELVALIASRHGRRRVHWFAAPAPVDVRSLAKVVTVLTLGAAAAHRAPILGRHRVDLDLRVGPLLRATPALPPFRDAERWDRVRLRHLLAGTTGHEHGFLFRTDAAELITHRPDDLPRYIAEHDLSHEPGTHFAYSNAGYYLLSVLVTEISGRSLAEWAGQLLFDPLETDGWSWRRYGRYPAAATGLRIRPDHLHRVTELLLRGGRHHGRRLVDAGWIAAMTSPQVVPAPSQPTAGDPLPGVAYGLGLWVSTPPGRCFGVGADGQYLVVDAASDTCITLTATRAEPDGQPALRSALAPLLALGSTAAGPSTLG